MSQPGSHAEARGRVTRSPLAGRRVLVTRRREQAAELSRRLRDYGAEVVEVPMIRLEAPADTDAPALAVRAFSGYDYVVFTSTNAVTALKIAADKCGVDIALRGPRVFAVGAATAAALEGIGLVCESLPLEYTSDGLARVLESHPMSGRRVLLPRAEVAQELMPTALQKRGAHVDAVAFYRTAPDPAAPGRLAEVLDRLQVVTFASGSSLAGFGAAVPAGWHRPPDLRVAVIGPATAGAARVAGLDPDIVAAEHTAAGLADAVAAYFERS